MKKLTFLILVLILFFSLTSKALAQEEILEGIISDIVEEKEIEIGDEKQSYQKLEILITKGSLKNQCRSRPASHRQSTKIQKRR